MKMEVGGEDLTSFLKNNLEVNRMDFEDIEIVIFLLRLKNKHVTFQKILNMNYNSNKKNNLNCQMANN